MSEIRDQLEAAAHELARLARGADPSRMDDPTPCPGHDVGTLMVHLMQEMVLHGWDVAAATGQTARFPDEVSATVLGYLDGDGEQERAEGWYGERVSTASDSLLDRAVAASGRDPEWTRPGAR